MMQSSICSNSHAYGNRELYQEVFKVLDDLRMADLKMTFQEHCIQDQTLSFVDSEDELKSLLKEIGIPIGKCFQFVKAWGKRYTSQEPIKMSANVPTTEKYTQVSIETADACIQTDDIFLTDADYNKLINSMTDMNLSSQQELINQYTAQVAGTDFKLNEHRISLSAGQAQVSYGTQQVDPYLAAHMWSSMGQYPDYAAHNMYGAFLPGPAPVTSVPSSMAVSDAVASQAGAIFNHEGSDLGHVARPAVTSRIPAQETLQHQRMSTSLTSTKDIVDEREDLAIEQSLKDFEHMEMESHSYASALNSDTVGLSQDSQHSYSSNPENLTNYISMTQRIQSSSVSQPSPLSRSSQHLRTVTSEKSETSHFSKCDDISLESGVSRLSSSLQNVGPQTLQGYLDSLPETPEYKQAMLSRNPKKGWKPLDGKHITSGKKVAFKPMYWDKEGRMRHGVPVRGSDKSEECWRHVEGKAPAGCTFAHSRLGDTLQFICVKCTYERNRTDWCSEKTKHKQYIFNLGAYKNLEGGTWKKSS